MMAAWRVEASMSFSASKRTSDMGWRPRPMYGLSMISRKPCRAPDMMRISHFTEKEPPGTTSAGLELPPLLLLFRVLLLLRVLLGGRLGLRRRDVLRRRIGHPLGRVGLRPVHQIGRASCR